jgi:uncharacterized protein YukE
VSVHALADIPFDAGAAEQLAAEFDAMADLLESQSGTRPGLAGDARASWEGALDGEFGDRIGTCVTDGQRLADAMRRAAQGVRELAAHVQEENRRRAHARAYEQEQADKAWYQRVGNNIADFFTGRDPIPPPPPAPSPPSNEVLVQVCATRG